MHTLYRGSACDKMHLFVEYHERIRMEELSVERSKLAEEVAKALWALQKNEQVAEPPVMTFSRRLTVKEFAHIIQRCEKHVLMKIRSEFIPKADRDGPPYKIHPRALLLFAVTLELGAARLAAWRQTQIKGSSPAIQPFAA